MKKYLFLWVVAALFTQSLQAQTIGFYYQGGNGDLYSLGCAINNYVSGEVDRFVLEISRDFGLPANDVRFYLRKGYSPSDLLMGMELAKRTRVPLKRIMSYYKNSRKKDWIEVSTHFGIGPSSAAFRMMLDRFRNYHRFWSGDYLKRHPGAPKPPVYKHQWSYFRPQAPKPHPAGPAEVRPPHQQSPLLIERENKNKNKNSWRQEPRKNTGEFFKAQPAKPKKDKKQGPPAKKDRKRP